MDLKKRFSRRLLLLVIASMAIAVLTSMSSIVSSRGQNEARRMELQSVQQAVALMMADNGTAVLPNPVTEPTSDMSLFPDATTSPEAKGLLPGDKPGYVLHGHDNTPDGQPDLTVDYISSPRTKWTYTVSRAGIVTQGEDSPE